MRVWSKTPKRDFFAESFPAFRTHFLNIIRRFQRPALLKCLYDVILNACGPCPPARDWGSRVSGLVLYKSNSTQSVKGLSRKLNFFSKKGLKIRIFFFSISPLTTQCTPNIGSVPIHDSRVFNKPLGRSLHSFTRTAHSAHLLSSIRLASSTG